MNVSKKILLGKSLKGHTHSLLSYGCAIDLVSCETAMSQNSHLRVNSSVLATFQENQADFFVSFLFWSVCKCVKDFRFRTYVSIHISLHHKLLSILFTHYQPCTSYKYLIGVSDAFCYFAFMTDVILSLFYCKRIRSGLVCACLMILGESSANLDGFVELEYQTLWKCQFTSIYVLTCTFHSKKLFCHLICQFDWFWN